MIQATPRKLRSGEWGAAIQSPPSDLARGDAVQVTARSGKTWTATVRQVVFTCADFALVATASAPRQLTRYRGPDDGRYDDDRDDGRCAECGCNIRANYGSLPSVGGLCYDCQ